MRIAYCPRQSNNTNRFLTVHVESFLTYIVGTSENSHGVHLRGIYIVCAKGFKLSQVDFRECWVSKTMNVTAQTGRWMHMHDNFYIYVNINTMMHRIILFIPIF